MRISDWSSDVCSSDLQGSVQGRSADRNPCKGRESGGAHSQDHSRKGMNTSPRIRPEAAPADRQADAVSFIETGGLGGDVAQRIDTHAASRSEEHTSELQSLMRISHADLCLKKK